MNVNFWLKKDESISLALYGLQGKLVKMVINEQNLGKGEHNIAVESNNLANGVYLCTLITEDRLISQKVVLVK